MECKEVLELSTAVIDGQLEQGFASQVHQHLSFCSACRNAFELETITIKTLQRTLALQPVPNQLSTTIRQQLLKESLDERSDALHSRSSIGSSLFSWRPMIAFSILALAIVVFVFIPTRGHHSHAAPNDTNVFHQVYNNYDNILNGKISPEIVSNDPDMVSSFFSSHTNYPASVPRMKDCVLVGGVLSQYNQENLSHVLYRHGNDFVYIYMANLHCVIDGKNIHIPSDALERIRQTGWYHENLLPDCSLIAWVNDSTLCCAIADVRHDELMTFLSPTETFK